MTVDLSSPRMKFRPVDRFEVHVDRRRDRRVPLATDGRCLFSDGRECALRLIDLSLGGMAVAVPRAGRIDERIVAYLDDGLGRFEGRIVRRVDDGFALAFHVSRTRRDRLADRLTWELNRDLPGLREERRAARHAPVSSASRLVLATGERLACRILDMSTTGASIEIDRRLAPGERVLLGRQRAAVVRLHERGVALRFVDPATVAAVSTSLS